MGVVVPPRVRGNARQTNLRWGLWGTGEGNAGVPQLSLDDDDDGYSVSEAGDRAMTAHMAAAFEQSGGVTWTGLPRQLNPPKKHSRRKSWMSQPLDEYYDSERPSTTGSMRSVATASTSSSWVHEESEDHHTRGVAQSLGRSASRVNRGRYEGPMAEWSPHPEGPEVDGFRNEVQMFEFGDTVFLQGLKSEDTWNGAEGIVEAFDPESLRYRVRLGDGRVKEVYGDNLERRDGRFQRPTTAQSTMSSQRPGSAQSVWTVSTRATTPSLGADWPRKRTTAEEAAAPRPATALVMQSLQPPALSPSNVM